MALTEEQINEAIKRFADGLLSADPVTLLTIAENHIVMSSSYTVPPTTSRGTGETQPLLGEQPFNTRWNLPLNNPTVRAAILYNHPQLLIDLPRFSTRCLSSNDQQELNLLVRLTATRALFQLFINDKDPLTLLENLPNTTTIPSPSSARKTITLETVRKAYQSIIDELDGNRAKEKRAFCLAFTAGILSGCNTLLFAIMALASNSNGPLQSDLGAVANKEFSIPIAAASGISTIGFFRRAWHGALASDTLNLLSNCVHRVCATLWPDPATTTLRVSGP